MTDAIVVERLVKRFGELTAVDALSFAVPRGTIFGLLGRNGAGKTTTLECCIGLNKPTSGSVRVLELDPTRPRELMRLRPRIGVQLQATSLPEKANVREVLQLYAAYYAIAPRAEEMAARVGLDDKLDRQIAQMSGGEQQRLALALALQHDPEVLFLDEPTAGMDAFGRRILWSEVERLRDAGKTIVLTTHYIEEAERLCDRICMIQRGAIVADGTPADLVARFGGDATVSIAADGFTPGGGLAAPRHLDADGRAVAARDARRAGPRTRGRGHCRQRGERQDHVARHAPAGPGRRVHRDHRRDHRRNELTMLRMFLVQTKMNFVWYFRRDGEMIFWTLAMPVFFLVLFSFAFSTGPNSGSSSFLVPGIIGAQVLSSGFWGVGVMLATFREKHLLRRVYLTPMPPAVFFASLVVYRVALLVAQATILVTVGALVFHVRIIGNPLEIVAILLLGTATFVSLGTIIGALARTTESANNIASILTVPLAFLSDAYVPIDRFPHAVSSALRLLPSTQFIDTFRDVSVYGQSLAHYGAWLALLLLWTVAGTVISARTFRWV